MRRNTANETERDLNEREREREGGLSSVRVVEAVAGGCNGDSAGLSKGAEVGARAHACAVRVQDACAR